MKKLIIIALIIVAAWYFLSKGKTMPATQDPAFDPTKFGYNPNAPLTMPTAETLAAGVKKMEEKMAEAQKLTTGGIKMPQITPELVNKVVEQKQAVDKTIEEIVRKQNEPILRTEQLSPTVIPTPIIDGKEYKPSGTFTQKILEVVKTINTSPVPVLKPLPISRPVTNVIYENSGTRKIAER